MFFRLLKITLFLTIVCSASAFSQNKDEIQKQREELESKVQENLENRIQSFVTQLKVDDFQKEIIKQKLHSYYREQKDIYLNTSLKYFERDEQISILTNSHFDDIKNLITEDTMDQIQMFVKDVGTTLDKQKKKKKKNKKKNEE